MQVTLPHRPADTSFSTSASAFARLAKSARIITVSARRASCIDAIDLRTLAAARIPSVATLHQIAALQIRDPDSLWVFERDRVIVGGVGLLLLNADGRLALLRDELNRAAPQWEFLAERNQVPAAIYLWALLARGTAFRGLHDLNRQCREGRLANVDLYASASTIDGERAMRLFGFSPFAKGSKVSFMRRSAF